MSADVQLQQIEEAAAAWIVERDAGFRPGREQEFQRWLGTDGRHAAAFAALDATWTLLALPAAVPSKRRRWAPCGRWLRQWSPALAAAAALVVIVRLWQASAPDEVPARAGPYATVAATDVGALRAVTLPDGTTVQLNTDSAMEVQFDATTRRVLLTRGEACFHVARQPERPFIVTAAGVDVRVVGTVFNVRLRQESVDVLVTEGRVKLEAPTGTHGPAAKGGLAPRLPELIAGQKLSIVLPMVQAPEATLPSTLPIPVTPVEIRQTLAWQSRRLDFDATPLSEIVAEINRYNRHKLVVVDERLQARRFGGSFPASDYATLVRMLEVDFGVIAEQGNGETRLRLRSEVPAPGR